MQRWLTSPIEVRICPKCDGAGKLEGRVQHSHEQYRRGTQCYSCNRSGYQLAKAPAPGQLEPDAFYVATSSINSEAGNAEVIFFQVQNNPSAPKFTRITGSLSKGFSKTQLQVQTPSVITAPNILRIAAKAAVRVVDGIFESQGGNSDVG